MDKNEFSLKIVFFQFLDIEIINLYAKKENKLFFSEKNTNLANGQTDRQKDR